MSVEREWAILSEEFREQARIDEFRRRFTWAGRIPGSPHEPLDVPTVRKLVLELWGDCVFDADRQIVALSRAGVLSLHEHDFPSSVSDQSTLLKAGQFSFCLVALRQ